MDSNAKKRAALVALVPLLLLTARAAAAAQPGIRGTTMCDADYAGALFPFPAMTTLGPLLTSISAAVHVNFIVQPAASSLPVDLPAGPMPWATVLRSLFHIHELAAICRSEAIVEVVASKDMPREAFTRTARSLAGTLSGFGALTAADGGASGQFGATVGVAFTNRVSAEFEFAAQPLLRDRHVDALGFPATVNGVTVSARPHVSAISYLGVARVDFPLTAHRFVPYAAIAGGVARVSIRLDLAQAGPAPVAPANIRLTITDQLPSSELTLMLRPTGGIAWPVGSTLSIGVEIGYARLFGASDDFSYGAALIKTRLLF